MTDPTLIDIVQMMSGCSREDAEENAWMFDSVQDGECDVCGYATTVEPDADYPCPECGEGRLQSVLIQQGLI